MDEAGYPGGRDAQTGQPLILNYDYQRVPTPELRAEIDWTIKQFAKLGVQLELRATDYNRFQDKMNTGSARSSGGAGTPTIPTPRTSCSCSTDRTRRRLTHGQGENAANYQNDDYDRLYEKLRYMDDGPEKQATIDRMVDIVRRDSPWLWGYNPYSVGSYQPWTSDAKPSYMVNDRLMYRRIDPAMRARLVREWNPPHFWPLWLIVFAFLAACGPRGARSRRASGPTRSGRRSRSCSRRREGGLMAGFLVRRVLYGILILIGVNLLTFILFFTVSTPDDMARLNIGGKYISQQQIDDWKVAHGYDKPLLWNPNGRRRRARLTDTVFWQRSARLFALDFGAADTGRDIGHEISERIGPSIALQAPVFALTIFVSVVFSLAMVFFRGSPLDFWGVVLSVVLLSISSLFYIIAGQYVFSKMMRVVPISGFADGLGLVKFLSLPILITLVSRLGYDARLYRAMFLEELSRDYVRTARAKGLSEQVVLFKHVLRNAMIPVITNVFTIFPILFLGSIVFESFFGIPGLGSYTIEAIGQQDFAVVRAMVFLGAILYVVGFLLADVAYTIADPRVRLA